MTAEPILEASKLGYRSGDGSVLLTEVTLTARRGDVVAIAGPNGAGKTTLLKLLAGLLPASSGTVRLFGTPLSDLSQRMRARRIAFLGQRDEPDGRLTAEEYVALGRIPHRRGADRASHESAIDAAIEAVGLVRKRGATLARLSGGEMQRAAIARALCQQPEILFLDEPTNHLDPRAKGELLSLIAGLGITTVCVLHDLTLIPALANQVVLVDDGALVVEGPTDETLTEEAVRKIFGVDFFELAHPREGRLVPAMDIPVGKSFAHHKKVNQEKSA